MKVGTGVPGMTVEAMGLAVWMLAVGLAVCALCHPRDTGILVWQGVDSRD